MVLHYFMLTFLWDRMSPPNYGLVLFYHPISNLFFKHTQIEISFFKPIKCRNRTSTLVFKNAKFIADHTPHLLTMTLMDAEYTKHGMYLVGASDINFHTGSSACRTSSQVNRFYALDPAIRHLCGEVTFPSNDGATLLSRIRDYGNILFGSSNALVQLQSSTPAWTISSRMINDPQHPLKFISGQGPVDGLSQLYILN